MKNGFLPTKKYARRCYEKKVKFFLTFLTKKAYICHCVEKSRETSFCWIVFFVVSPVKSKI
jgi:hypothetical protein